MNIARHAMHITRQTVDIVVKPWLGDDSTTYRPVTIMMNSRTAPLMSNPLDTKPVSLGMAWYAMTAAMIPIGTLMKNTRCQLIISARTLPSVGPTAAPREVPRMLTDSANAVILRGRNLTQTMNAVVAIIAAPRPCTALNTRRTSREKDSPQASELNENMRSPATNSFLIAPLSAIFPMTKMRPAIIRKYTVTTQDVISSPMPKSSAISGRTTFTMVPSRPSRNSANATTMSSIHCFLWSSMMFSMVGGNG